MVFDLAFLQAYWELVQNPLIVLGVLTILDLLFGVIVAWRKGEFEWSKIGDVALGNVLKVLVYSAFSFLALTAEMALGDDAGWLSQLGISTLTANGLAVFVGLGIGGSLLGHFAYLVPGWKPEDKKLGIKPT